LAYRVEESLRIAVEFAGHSDRFLAGGIANGEGAGNGVPEGEHGPEVVVRGRGDVVEAVQAGRNEQRLGPAQVDGEVAVADESEHGVDGDGGGDGRHGDATATRAAWAGRLRTRCSNMWVRVVASQSSRRLE